MKVQVLIVFCVLILQARTQDQMGRNCVTESFPDLSNLTTITESLQNIGDGLFSALQQICENRTLFVQCVDTEFSITPLSHANAVLDDVFNLGNVGTVLNQFCSSFSVTDETCVKDSAIGVYLCSISSLSVIIQNPIELMNSNDTSENIMAVVCPFLQEMIDCTSMQFLRCSSDISDVIRTIDDQMLSTDCLTASSQGNASKDILNSAILQCGFSFYGEVAERTSGGVDDTFALIQGLFEDACSFAGVYAECVVREVPTSSNIFDQVLRRIVDFSDANRLKTVFSTTCDSIITKQGLQNTFDCGAKNSTLQALSQCLGPEDQEILSRFGNIEQIDLNTVQEMCQPLKNIGLCLTEAIGEHCNSDLGLVARNFILELLRIDCGGERPITGSASITSSINSLFILLGLYIVKLIL